MSRSGSFCFPQEPGLLLFLVFGNLEFLSSIGSERRRWRQQPTSHEARAGLTVGVDVLVGVKGTWRRPEGGSEDPAQIHSAVW